MDIRPEVSYKYTLSLDDLVIAVKNYINAEGGVVGDIYNVTVVPRTKDRSLPSLHPSSNIEVYNFDGVDVLISSTRNDIK